MLDFTSKLFCFIFVLISCAPILPSQYLGSPYTLSELIIADMILNSQEHGRINDLYPSKGS
jgi:hypothetical protein